MRYKKLILPIMALMLSCNFITGLGSGSSAGGGVDLDSPADPVNVTVVLNEDETTSAVISPEGGELTLTSADGSVYTLEVPAGALLADTEISMTTIGSLEGGPVESNVYGVQLEPSGLAFYEFLTLTIQPAAEIPLEEQFMFKYEGNGENLHHALVDPNSEEIRIKLLSFSGAGAGLVTEVSKNIGQIQDAQLRFDNALGELFQSARKETNPAIKDTLVNVLDDLLNTQSNLVEKLISRAKEDCQYLEPAIEAKQMLDKYKKELYSLFKDVAKSESSGGGGGDDDDLAPIKDLQNDELNKLKEKCLLFSAEMKELPLKSDAIRLTKKFILKGNYEKCSHVMTFYPSESSPLYGITSLESDCGKYTASGMGDYTVNLTETGGVIKGNTGWLTTVQNDANEQTPFTVILTRIAP